MLIFLTVADDFQKIRKDGLRFTLLSLSNPFNEVESFCFIFPISIGDSISTDGIKSFCFLLPFPLNNSVILFFSPSCSSRYFKSSLLSTGSKALVPVTDIFFSAEDHSSSCSLT